MTASTSVEKKTDGYGAVVVEVRGEPENPVGQGLDAAVPVVLPHGAGVVEHQVDGGPPAAHAVLLQRHLGAPVQAGDRGCLSPPPCAG